MATTDTNVIKKRIQKEKPNSYKRMHSDQPGEKRQGFVHVVEKFGYMKIKWTYEKKAKSILVCISLLKHVQ